MSLFKKVISFREKSDPEQEKPFLEHLEDLRTMIFRIVVTLLISMVLCFSFQSYLLDVLRRPIQQVWEAQTAKTLPKEGDAPRQVSVKDWEQALRIEKAVASLSEREREAFYANLADESLVFHVRSVTLMRAADALPDGKKEGFIRSLKLDEELTAQVLALIKSGPETDHGAKQKRELTSLKPTETFMLSMKLAFIAGILLALPLLLYFVLQFVLPGLHDNERKALWPALAIGTGLFLSGVCFAYFVVLRRALDFFFEWSAKMEVVNEWRIGEYISFATNFTLLFGVSFELPVVVMLFVKLGILSYDIMSRTRRYAIVAIFILAAVITPTPDIMTLCLMALPMLLLYECCIWLAWLDRKKQRERDAEEAKQHEEWLARRAAELREKAREAELDSTLAGDLNEEKDRPPHDPDAYDPDHAEYDFDHDDEHFHHHDEHIDEHGRHVYGPYDDSPEDYNWDENHKPLNDEDHKDIEDDESELDDELDKSKEQQEEKSDVADDSEDDDSQDGESKNSKNDSI